MAARTGPKYSSLVLESDATESAGLGCPSARSNERSFRQVHVLGMAIGGGMRETLLATLALIE